MGGRIRVVVHPSPDDPRGAKATAAVSEAFKALDAMEAVLSDWRPGSELSGVSKASGGAPVPIGSLLMDTLTTARHLAEATGGAFDPTVGPLSALWREARETGREPSSADIAAARALIGWEGLELLPATATSPSRARLARPGMRLDLGAIGKGVAVDQLSDLLDRLEVPVHLVDFGSAMRAGSAPAGREGWLVEAPRFGEILLCRSALAISGSDAQSVAVEEGRASHLADPRPGKEGLGLRTPVLAAVIGPEAAVADALATALCVVGAEEAPRVARRFGRFSISVIGPAPERGDDRAGRAGRASEPRFSTPEFTRSGVRCARGTESIHPLRRVLLPGNRAVLEVAAMRFVREGLPTVTLVGVTHIGEAAFYAALERFFETQDLVLYESVMPAGVGGLADVPPEERRARTREVMTVLAELLEAVRLRSRSLPPELAGLSEAMRAVDTRFVPLVPDMTRDAWGRGLLYERRFDDQGEAIDFELRSLGADGAKGGGGDDADIVLTRPARGAIADEGLQANLADALGLQFQLRAIDYSKPNFRLADMSLPELEAALAARGADDGGLMGTLAGTSLPARMASMLLGVLKVADGLTGGALREMIKAVLLELFADGEILAAAEKQLGQGFMEVILVERNAAAIAGLSAVAPDSEVAILYGAAHLPDMARRLETEGYRLDDITWFPAIEVDLAKAGLDRRQLELLRREIKASLRGKR